MYYYDPATRGFYRYSKIGRVAVDDSRHEELMTAQSRGLQIEPDEHGAPRAVEVVMTAEQMQRRDNIEARNYLASTDWYVIRQQETGQPVPPEILAERAAQRARVVE